MFNYLVIVYHTFLYSVFFQELQLFRTQAYRHSSLSVRPMIKITHVLIIELCKIIFVSFFPRQLRIVSEQSVPIAFLARRLAPEKRRLPKHSSRTKYA